MKRHDLCRTAWPRKVSSVSPSFSDRKFSNGTRQQIFMFDGSGKGKPPCLHRRKQRYGGTCAELHRAVKSWMAQASHVRVPPPSFHCKSMRSDSLKTGSIMKSFSQGGTIRNGIPSDKVIPLRCEPDSKLSTSTM